MRAFHSRRLLSALAVCGVAGALHAMVPSERALSGQWTRVEVGATPSAAAQEFLLHGATRSFAVATRSGTDLSIRYLCASTGDEGVYTSQDGSIRLRMLSTGPDSVSQAGAVAWPMTPDEYRALLARRGAAIVGESPSDLGRLSRLDLTVREGPDSTGRIHRDTIWFSTETRAITDARFDSLRLHYSRCVGVTGPRDLFRRLGAPKNAAIVDERPGSRVQPFDEGAGTDAPGQLADPVAAPADVPLRAMAEQYGLNQEQQSLLQERIDTADLQDITEATAAMSALQDSVRALVLERGTAAAPDVQRFAVELDALLEPMIDKTKQCDAAVQSVLGPQPGQAAPQLSSSAGLEALKQQVERWKNGEFEPEELARPSEDVGEPPVTPSSAEGAVRYQAARGDPFPIHSIEAYVQAFVDANQLDSAQSAQAWSLFSRAKTRAETYYTEQAAAFDELSFVDLSWFPDGPATPPQEQEAEPNPADPLSQLTAPLLVMFEELKAELEGLLEQRQHAGG